jgi:hypothetical protein
MLRWIADQIVHILNYVPELFLDKDDPHFDILRWWLAIVVVVVLVLIFGRMWRALRRPQL